MDETTEGATRLQKALDAKAPSQPPADLGPDPDVPAASTQSVLGPMLDDATRIVRGRGFRSWVEFGVENRFAMFVDPCDGRPPQACVFTVHPGYATYEWSGGTRTEAHNMPDICDSNVFGVLTGWLARLLS